MVRSALPLGMLAFACAFQVACSGGSDFSSNGTKTRKSDAVGKPKPGVLNDTDEPKPLIIPVGSETNAEKNLPPGTEVIGGESEDPKVATFDPKTGAIVAVGVGETVIKVTTKDGVKEIVVKVVKPDEPADDVPPVGVDVGEGFTKNPELFALEPAVIVQRPACVACHAQIKGSFISDFNIKAKPFNSRSGGLTKDAAGNLQNIGVIVDAESLRPLAFRSMNLDGAFVVPQVEMSGGDIFQAFKLKGFAGPSLALAEALKLEQAAVDGEEAYEAKGIKQIAIQTVGAGRDKSKPGVNEIKAISSIEIVPPTETEIKGLVGQSKGELFASGDTKVMKLTDSSVFEGMSTKAGKTGPYVTNTGAVTCKGDILVLGTLVFNELGDLTVDAKSCRIYVSGSIFVRGPINANGGTVQLATGRVISMGIRDSRITVNTPEAQAERANVYDVIEDTGVAFVMRMKTSKTVIATTTFSWIYALGRNPAQQPAEVEAARVAYASYNNAAIWKRVGTESPKSPTCTFDAGTGPVNPTSDCEFFARGVETPYGKHREVSYRGLLLAAPEVHGRYHGKITGVVVATLAVFALADFEFEADVRFKDVPILPALGRKLVDIK